MFIGSVPCGAAGDDQAEADQWKTRSLNQPDYESSI